MSRKQKICMCGKEAVRKIHHRGPFLCNVCIGVDKFVRGYYNKHGKLPPQEDTEKCREQLIINFN